MHRFLHVDEILRILTYELVASEAKATAVALACCCRGFEEPVLDGLWETQYRLTPLLKCFPRDIWKEEDGHFVSPPTTFIPPVFNRSIWESFKRVPTKAEWVYSRKYARRMRRLKVDTSEDPITSDILLVLQLRAANDPWLPRLKTFICEEVNEAFIPFIPFFLSPRTIRIKIGFTENSPMVVIASMIASFSTLCPDLECIILFGMPGDPVITSAVSELLLGCNRDILQTFQVDSPLTEEAREVLYRLPRLSDLWAVIQGPASLPTVALPNLTTIDLEYGDHLDWLQRFRGATFEKLEEVTLRSESQQTGDFLGSFESVVLTTSAQNTLSKLNFHTSRPWSPNYSSLLSFKQLKEIVIEFSCNGGCSSMVDDNIIIDLARAMPKLEVLQLGRAPCRFPTGITVNGLINLTCRCPQLSKLRIHFQATSLVDASTSAATRFLSGDEPIVRRKDCALSDLEVGAIPFPAGSASTIALILLQIFPRILNVRYFSREWEAVAEMIKEFRRLGVFVGRSGKVHPSHLVVFSDVSPADAIDVGRPAEDSQV